MSHYFPMVSSSPPPFEDNHNYEDEIDDEFGDFSSAGDILQDGPTYTNGIDNFGFSTQQKPPHCKQIDEDENVANRIKIPTIAAPETPVVTNGESDSIADECGLETETYNFSNLSNNLNRETPTIDEFSCENDDKEDLTIVDPPQDTKIDFAPEVDFEDANDGFQWGNVVDEDFSVTLENLNDTSEKCAVTVDNSLEANNLDVQEVVELEENIESNIALELNVNDQLPLALSENLPSTVEDDDFADFQTVVENSGEDINDFQTFETAPLKFHDNDVQFVANFDAFNDDSSKAFQSSATEDFSEDDEFGNFESTPQISNFEHLISSTLSVVFENVNISGNSSVVSPAILRFDDLLLMKASNASSECVWEKLNDIDNTHALTYHWSTCRSNKLLLHSLHLNSQNFLPGAKWSSSIPLFAANLASDPLEPTKAPFNTLFDDSSIQNHITQSSVSASLTAETIVPPAQFDWGSSGLINPLDDSTSALLDLDFFLTNDYVFSNSSYPSKKINSLESEFLGVDSSVRGSDFKPLSPLVDKILSEANRTGTKSAIKSRRKNMSDEAKRILDSLQDLSFMQAKMLMFPIRDGWDFEM